MNVNPIDVLFDSGQNFSLEDVDNDMDMYLFIARKRAEARGDSTDTDSYSKGPKISHASTIDLITRTN